MFTFHKPPDWYHIPLSFKINHYYSQTGKLHSYYVDKLYAKRIVKDLLGDDIEIPRTVRVLKNCEDVQDSDLNPNYIIKASHGSSWNIILGPNNKYDKNEIIKTLKSWNRHFMAETDIQERQYQYIAPKFFIEEKIVCKYQGHNGKALTFSLYCIQGKISYIQVIDKYADIIDHFDEKWNLLDMYKNGRNNVKKPDNLDKMINLAERLAKEFEFMRIDFYLAHDNKIYFSEYTFSPCMGLSIYGRYDYVLGDTWKQ